MLIDVNRQDSLKYRRGGAAHEGSPAAASAGATARTGLAFLRLIDPDVSAVEAGAIQGLDRRVGVLLGPHLYEREPARASGVPVHDETDTLHLARILRERGPNRVLGGVKREIAYVKLATHGSMARATVFVGVEFERRCRHGKGNSAQWPGETDATS